jgi:RNA polymerase sigma-70 factor (ECF subfamily)
MNDGEVMRSSVDDPAAFHMVFDRYHARIFSYLAGRVGPTDAEDLASEVFVAAFRQRAKFREDAVSAGPWLYGIAANLARRNYRSRARRRRAHGRAPADDGIWFDPDRDAQIDAARRIELLRSELNRLREKDREVLFLYALADLSYAEIAEALDIPVGTVRSRLSRTRERLRNLLPDEGKDKGEGTAEYGGGE